MYAAWKGRRKGRFPFAFDACPHDAALLVAVGASAGHKEEGHGWVDVDESLGCGHSHIVGDAE
jgi:hypothetical protein